MRILDLVSDQLVSKEIATKRFGSPGLSSKKLLIVRLGRSCSLASISRDLFYKDPELFRKQTTVDKAVEVIANHFCVPRHNLNVVNISSQFFG
jgi:hypothetical protein